MYLFLSNICTQGIGQHACVTIINLFSKHMKCINK